MKKFIGSFGIALALVAGSAFMAPAMAEDIDIVISTDAWDVNQGAIAGAYGTADVTVDAVNIASLASFTGLNTDDLWIDADAFDVNQLAIGIGYSEGTCGGGCASTVVDVSATNLAAAVLVDVKEVLSESSDTIIDANAIDVNQAALSIAWADAGASVASATNIAGLADVSIDVD